VLPIAPAAFYDNLAKRHDPSRLSDRATRDEELKPEVERVFEENLSVYCVRKVWHQMHRKGFDIPRCTVARLRKDIGIDALEQAIHQRRPAQDQRVHHSDRGSQYLSIKYTERLAGAKIAPSVGSIGDSYDNALAETSNGLFKAEVIHRRGPWRSFDTVAYATLEWVEWFNNRRLLELIGNIQPAEAEANFYAGLERSEMAA
jgi:transposase InsO family protein